MAEIIRVATFNIRHGSTLEDYKGNAKALADACAELDADILGLQEVDRGIPRSGKVDQAKFVAEALGMAYVFAKARKHNYRGQYGNALLVRGEIYEDSVEVIKLRGDRRHKVRLGNYEFQPFRELRNILLANVRVHGHEIAVGVTHVGGKKRGEMLGLGAAALANRFGPQILLMDSNLRQAGTREAVEPHGFAIAAGPATNPLNQPKWQIDHIAYSPDITIEHIEAVALPVSDHRALKAEITL